MRFDYKPYVPVAKRRKQAARKVATLAKGGATLEPVAAGRGAMTRTFWGNAWCRNLEQYSDYANRLPRGRTYLRNGSVIDLKVAAGKVTAQVMGSRLYKVKVECAPVPAKKWQGIAHDCAQSIDSLVELLQGQLSASVMERITQPGTGLFPTPKEISFDCSCPDWAVMCKHVAATLYGVGARLDAQPELLFSLRQVDAAELIAKVGASGPAVRKTPGAGRILESSKLADVFGIEIAGHAEEAPPAGAAARPRKKSPPTKRVKKASKKRKAPRRPGA